jgi:alpha-L-fucosidase
MTFLLNVTPDRHGVIPELEQKRLREMGAWMAKMGDAIYGTRGGPWQPVDRQYGYCYKGSTVFVHLLKDYPGNIFEIPSLEKLRVKKVYEVYTGKPLSFEGDSSVTIRDIDRTSSTADSVIAVVYDEAIRRVWGK